MSVVNGAANGATRGERDPMLATGALILKAHHKPVIRVETARSFSYKLNAGNYESRDFFCSQKAECAIEDAPEVSAALFAFCRAEVLRSVKEYIAEMKRQKDGMDIGRTA